jgi:SAM-dependent methyltransferase
LISVNKESEQALRASDFERIAAHGFGDPCNSYPHCMASYRGHVYVGTTRNVLQLVKISPDPNTTAFHVWPVPVPPGTDASTLDQGSQIWRFQPGSTDWEQVFNSPRVGRDPRSLWRDFGYRSMAVVQTRGDDEPALYVTTMAPSKAPGALILRSLDGRNFAPVTEPGMGDTSVSSYRALVGFAGRLYTAPAGSGRMWSFAERPVILETDDPVHRSWRVVNEPGFGDPCNGSISEMAVFNDQLYAGTITSQGGFQVWRTSAQGGAPYAWRKVVDRGADRGSLNQGVLSMFAFGDALYVGSGIRRGGHDRELKIGPAPAELIRIHPDDSWDLIVGSPRVARSGLKSPLSGLGPGFNNSFGTYFWSMASYNNCLYVGTLDTAIFLAYLDPRKVRRPNDRQRLQRSDVDTMVQQQGGFDLWATADGRRWTRVSRNGLGNPYNYGVRTMLARPEGLYLGAANPFGPEVAVKTATGWTYVPNPRGGLEVWVGRPRVAEKHPVALEPISNIWTQSVGSTNLVRRSNNHQLVRTRSMSRPNGNSLSTSRSSMYAAFQPRSEKYWQGRSDLTGPGGDFFEASGFANYGYWRADTRSQREACENLVDILLTFAGEGKGKILDVACGFGATTRYLLKYYPPSAITGIDVSELQLQTCRMFAPGCTFLLMDATAMQFPAQWFDTVICIEAAFHFQTRRRFLEEAMRVLKPGGWLVASDILFKRETHRAHAPGSLPNWIPHPEAYAALLRETGYVDIEVVDATRECWMRPRAEATEFLENKYRLREISLPEYRGRVRMMALVVSSASYYVLAAGRKPQ